MDEKITYWGSIALSAIALVALVANITLSNSNRILQGEVTQRQAAISGGQQLSSLNQGLVQALAEAAVKNNNSQIKDLLTSQGITLKSETAPAVAAKPAEKK